MSQMASAVAGLDIADLSVQLGGQTVLHNIELRAQHGEFVVLAGPSGSGKSTLLRAIAGLLPCAAGRIAAGGFALDGLPPGKRDIAMVFQDHALMPHLTVAGNLMFGLRARGTARRVAQARAADVAERLGLGELLHRPASQLSGGERQRVALGRAMLRDARLVLMDEPLSSLDAPLRARMRREILELHRRQGWTTVYVTHDQAEALSMADRLGVLIDGVLQQVDAPLALYQQPANTAVAAFLGQPAMQLFNAEASSAGVWLLGRDRAVTLGTASARLVAGIRAEAVEVDGSLWSPLQSGSWPVPARISRVEHLGDVQWLHCDVGDESLIARVEPERRYTAGAPIALALSPDRVCWFDARTGLRL